MEGGVGVCLCEVGRKRRRRPEWRREELVPKRLRQMAASAAVDDDEQERGGKEDYFERLPDDLVVSVLCKISSSAACPADFLSAISACKRFNYLGLHETVLFKASARALAVRAENWSDSSHRFLKLCINAGNLEAHYILGMIRFYCLRNRGGGAALMAKAAIKSHSQSLYSLAVIQFNGSGGSKSDKDLRAGVALCARAAFLGHIDALRELGHCLQDGYGVRRNVPEGRRFLIQANARELAAALYSNPATAAASWPALYHLHRQSAAEGADRVAVPVAAGSLQPPTGGPCPLLSDYGWSLPAPEPHPANQFMTEWFVERGRAETLQEGLRLCSHGGCGRPETRRHEFRRCSVCGTVNYCSRACQALDWKILHKAKCVPIDHWLIDGPDAPAGDVGGAAENGGAGLE